MSTQRVKKRIYNKEFVNFTVQLQKDNKNVQGYLGDISDEGMCAILPGIDIGDFIKGDQLTGTLGGKHLREEMRFDARIIWKSEEEVRKEPALLIGLNFNGRIDLPDAVIAAELGGMY